MKSGECRVTFEGPEFREAQFRQEHTEEGWVIVKRRRMRDDPDKKPKRAKRRHSTS